MKKTLFLLALLCAMAPGARAQANWDAVYAMTQTTAGNWTALEASTTGRTLGSAGNTTYWYANSNLSFTNSNAGGSALTILGTVYIYVPEGVTVTCTGANANGQTGAGAGIELASGNTLYLLGGGTVNATGGNAANGGNGNNGNDASCDFNNMNWAWVGGGGAGGNGGGGAGAGIGTRGGNGGAGGSAPESEVYYSTWTENGIAGSNGSAGQSAGGMGTLYMVTSFVHLNATGGSQGSAGTAGTAGTSCLRYGGNEYSIPGGGGGGAGGFGGAASDIGTGGPGGGGGGGGAKGSHDYTSTGFYNIYANGGAGGKNADGTDAPSGGNAGVSTANVNNGTCQTNNLSWVQAEERGKTSSDVNETTNGGTGGANGGNTTAGSANNIFATDESGSYLIASMTDWNTFTSQVANGNNYSGKTLKLTTNISTSTMVGPALNRPFRGTFDGNGHTLTFTQGSSNSNFNENLCAPFRYTRGATIRNLKVDGTIYTSQQYAGGLIARCEGTTNITNCNVGTFIYSNTSGEGRHGGIVAGYYSSNGEMLNITGCAYTGRLRTYNGVTTGCGGFVGYHSDAPITISYSFYAPSTIGYGTWPGDISDGKTFVHGDYYHYVSLSNYYYTRTMGDSQGTQPYRIIPGTDVTIENAGTASNEYDVSELVFYGQSFRFGDLIYAVRNINVSLTIGSNRPGYMANGYQASGGTLSGSSNPYTLAMPSSDVTINATSWNEELQPNGNDYSISNATEWESFCLMVANDNDFSGKTVTLTDDISVTMKCGIVSGSTQVKAFSGTFDGDGHTITATITDSRNQGTALFCNINGATIRDLTVAGTITSEKYHTSGLVGFAGGTNLIEDCDVTATLNINTDYAGGIVGHGLESNTTIRGCVFAGTINGVDESRNNIGGIWGWSNSATPTLVNCIEMGTYNNIGSMHPMGLQGSTGTITNCYYVNQQIGSPANACTVEGAIRTYATFTDGEIYRVFTIKGHSVYSASCTVSGVSESYHLSSNVISITPVVTDPYDSELAFGTDYTATLNGAAIAELPINISEMGEYTLTITGVGNYTGVKDINFEVTLGGEGTEEQPYLISSENHWNEFVNQVNRGNTYSGKYVKLTADISVTTMAGGSESNSFRGIFLGNNKTLTFNKGMSSEAFGEQNCAPFRFVSGATIQDLTVAGNIYTSQKFAGGLVSRSYGTLNITNCHVGTVIHSSVSGDGTHGGLVAMPNGGTSLTIAGCMYDGRLLTNSSTTTCGGFVGWHGGATISVTNSLYAPSGSTPEGWTAINNGATFVRGGNPTIDYCYYTETMGTTQGSLAYTSVPDNEISLTVTICDVTVYPVCTISGIAASYTLLPVSITPVVSVPDNATSLTFGTDYTVTLNGDAVTEMPITISAQGSYTLVFTGTGDYFGSKTYQFDADSPFNGDGTEQSPYLISNASDWDAFCSLVASGTTFSGKYMKLDANISVSTKCGTVSGSSQVNAFSGIFDGDGNTITATITDNANQGTALFCYINGATIKNLTVAGTITSSQYFAGGLVGFAKGTGNSIENCVVTANVSGSIYVGGIVGDAVDGDISISGCLFSGLMTGGSLFQGAIIGRGNSGIRTVTNCLYLMADGQSTSSLDLVQGGGTLTITQCYKTTSAGSYGKMALTVTCDENVTIESITPVGNSTATYNVSGITAYGNGITYNGTVYCGEGDQVSLTLSSTLPEVEFLASDGTLTGSGNTYTLTMPASDVTITAFGNLRTDASGNYLISSASDWGVFCGQVANGNSYSGEIVKLTTNISVTRQAGVVSGSTLVKAFSGTFDGQGNSITASINDYYDYNQGTALFCYIDGATIKNLTAGGTINASSNHAAGLVGFANGACCIENCVVTTTVNGINYVGGIVGHALDADITISGCVFSGVLAGGVYVYKGAFIGWDNSGNMSVTNCLYLMADGQETNRLDLEYCNGPITVTNCYKTTSKGSYGKLPRTITAGENITIDAISPVGNSTATYTVSDITAYGMGIIRGETFYYGKSDQVSLTLSYTGNTPQGDPEPGYTYGYIASAGTLTGTENPYTLTMPNADVTINYGLVITDWAGTGEYGDPYIITTPSQLDLLAQRVNSGTEYEGKYFKLGNDIAYSHTTAWNDTNSTENNYTAIGKYTYDYDENEDYFYYFQGDFDGDGHTISGIRIYKDGTNVIDKYQGIFGMTGGRANIHGITLADARITGYDYTGGIVGKNNGGTITDCHVAATVAIHAIYDDTYEHGGIVGYNYDGIVSHCTSSATLTTDDVGNNWDYGAICGYNRGTLSDNFVVGATVPTAADNCYGAICGYNDGGTVDRNYYTACTIAGVENATGVGCGMEVDDDEYESVDVTANDGAVPAFSITAGSNVTMANAGNVTYNPIGNGLTSYTTGIEYNGVLYAANGNSVSLTLGSPVASSVAQYTASAGTLSGSENPYTLTMPAENVTINVNALQSLTATVWRAIATPMHDAGEDYESIANVTNLTDASYDLFRYNESSGTWENHKASHVDFDALTPGRGYIYRCSDARTLTYTGVPNNEESYSIELTNTGAAGDLKGFNLVGNPYPFRVKLNRDFYALNADGTWTAHLGGDSLEVGQGALVYAESTETLTFYAATRSTNAGNSKGLPPLPKGLCLGESSEVGGMRSEVQVDFVRWDGDQLVITGTGLLTAYDAIGRELFHENVSTYQRINVSTFPGTGVYILRLNGQSQKIVINK